MPHSKLEILCLRLRSLTPSHHTPAPAPNFRRLTKLAVTFGLQSILSGRYLGGLAQKCPDLADVCLGGSGIDMAMDEGTRPSAFRVTDSLIREIAQHLPKLQSFRLLLSRPDILAWEAVLSIARFCPNLEYLQLSCSFKWKEVVNSTPGIMFRSYGSLI